MCLFFDNTRKNFNQASNLKVCILIWTLSLLIGANARKFTEKSRNHSVMSYKINSTTCIQKILQGDSIIEWLHQRILSSAVKVRATIHLAITCSRSENLSPCLSELTFVYGLLSLCRRVRFYTSCFMAFSFSFCKYILSLFLSKSLL